MPGELPRQERVDTGGFEIKGEYGQGVEPHVEGPLHRHAPGATGRMYALEEFRNRDGSHRQWSTGILRAAEDPINVQFPPFGGDQDAGID